MKNEAKADRRNKKVKDILGKKDEAIIHCIEQNPEILLKNISGEIKASGGLSEEIPYPTLQRHVNKLIEKKVIGRYFSVNWAVAEYMVRYRVGILIDPKELRDESIADKRYNSQEGLADYIMKELAKDKPFKNELVIDDVYILLGGNVDLAVDFYAKDDTTATKFIIDKLRKLPAVSNTVSAKLAYSSKHGWLSKNGNEQDS
jgi:DNA-binding Lrp family transcriptional regulator